MVKHKSSLVTIVVAMLSGMSQSHEYCSMTTYVR